MKHPNTDLVAVEGSTVIVANVYSGAMRRLAVELANPFLTPTGERVRLVQPAIALAENGFPISPRLQAQIESDPFLRSDHLSGVNSRSHRSVKAPSSSPVSAWTVVVPLAMF